MNINGKITILINREGTHIELYDEDSSITFLRITLTPEELSSALSRLAYTPCVMEVHGIEKLGKKQEIKTLIFQIPKDYWGSEHHTVLNKIAQDILDMEGEGWLAEDYFASQNTFFYKDELPHARCTCRRWVDKK